MLSITIDGSIYCVCPRGGIDRYFTETMAWLAREPGLDIRCVMQPGCPPPLRDQDGIHFVYRHPSNKALDAWRTRPWQSRIFHSSYYTPPPRPNLPYIVTVYDFIDQQVPSAAANPGNFFENQCDLIKRADAVLTISQSTRNDILLHTGIPADRITVAYPGISSVFKSTPVPQAEIERFRKTAALGRPYWLYVGRRENYKNFATLLTAFSRIADKTDTHLVVIGGEPKLNPSLMERLISLRCETRVTLLKRVDDQILKTAYSGALAFIQPSLAEGFGIPLVEAIACKTPLVVSDIPVFHEVAGHHASYFDPHDPEALEEQLHRILRSPPPPHLLETATDSIHTRFDWQQTAREWLAMYKNI